MRKKILAIICALSIFVLVACTTDKENPYELIQRPNDFSYYPETKLNKAKHLYVFGRENDRNLNHVELVLGQGIQGIFAQEEVTFYLSNNDHYDYWLEYLETTYNITSENILLLEMVSMYTDTYDEVGYILYDYSNNPESVNVATTLAGLKGYIPVDITLEEKVKSQGLELKIDATTMSEKELFETYKGELNNTALVQIRQDISHFRDFGVAFKYLHFYQDRRDNTAINLRGDIHSWAKIDSPIFGWGPGVEDSHVGIASRHGQFTIPSDYSYNTTVFAAKEFKIDTIEQPNQKETITAQEDKHYVTFVRSDGDNIQTWYNYFPFDIKDMGALRSNFKFAWSIQPSLIDLAPHIVKHTYENADENDYFVAAVSGFGYMYPSLYPDLKGYLSSLDLYMSKLDLSIVQILDSGPYEEVINYYAEVDSIKGAMYMYGEKYMGGQGEIFWSTNGKPFISFRESIWDVRIDDVATRINGYETNPKHISGYSLINLHPWSHSYQDIENLVSQFKDHVVVVSPETFFDLIIENVPKVNAKP